MSDFASMTGPELSRQDQVPRGVVLIIGALESDLALAAAYQEALMLQPEAASAKRLAQRAAGDGRITVLAGGVGAQKGTGTLQVMNFPELSSLRAPTPALQALFPGLRRLDQQEVELHAVDELLALTEAGPDPLHLAINAPGDELMILQSLADSGELHRFDALRLRCGEEVFFQGATARQGLEEWLLAQDFTLQGCDISDPDWPVLSWRLDRKARELKHLLAQREAEITALKAEISAKTAKAEADLAAQAEQTKKAKSDLAETTARLEAELQGLNAQLAAQEGKAREASAAQDRALLDAQKQIAQQQADLARAQVAQADLDHRLHAARNDLRRSEGQLEVIKDLLLRGESL